MNSKPFVVNPTDRSTALSVIGTSVTVLVSDADSKDQQITLQSGDEGMGPPPHSHDWDESFYVTKGQVQFTSNARLRCAWQARLYMSLRARFTHSAMALVGASCWRLQGEEARRSKCFPRWIARFRLARRTLKKWFEWLASTVSHFTSDAAEVAFHVDAQQGAPADRSTAARFRVG